MGDGPHVELNNGVCLTSSSISSRDAILVALARRTWIFLVLSTLATGLSSLCYFRALQLGRCR